MMRIVQIGSYPLSEDCMQGGVEASVFGLTLELAKSYKVDVFDIPRLGGKDRIEQYGNLTIHRYSNIGRYNKDAVSRAAEMVRDIVCLHPDICHLHGTGTFSKHIYAALVPCKVPLFLTVHGLQQEEKLQALRSKPTVKRICRYIVQTRDEKKLLNAAQRVFVDTAYVAEKLQTYHLSGAPDVFVVPQGIDAAYYGIRCAKKSNVLLSVGAITPRKGQMYVVEVFDRLREMGIIAKLHIIGAMADKAYYEALLRRIAISPFNKDIHVEVDVHKDQLIKAYAEAKLFVLHSREESQGIVLAEAMATGMPVVATNVGGIPYVVENGQCGLLSPYGDIKAMAENITRLLSDDSQWRAYSENAVQKAKQYNWKEIAEMVVQRYATCL